MNPRWVLPDEPRSHGYIEGHQERIYSCHQNLNPPRGIIGEEEENRVKSSGWGDSPRFQAWLESILTAAMMHLVSYPRKIVEL